MTTTSRAAGWQSRTVHFQHPFTLPQVEGVLPAGSYAVDEEFVQLDAMSRVAFRRITTVLHLRVSGGIRESVEVDGGALDAALHEDAAKTAPGTSP